MFGPFQLDAAAHRLLRDGQELPLTSAEYALLAAFCQRPARVLSRDLLVDLLKGHERDAFDRSIDSRVTRLRRKIEDDPAAPLYIRTVRGEGYLFNPRGGRGVKPPASLARQHTVLLALAFVAVELLAVLAFAWLVMLPLARRSADDPGRAHGAVGPDLGRAAARHAPGV